MGSTTPGIQDVNDAIDDLLKRLYVLEQTITDPDHLAGGSTVITVDGSILVMQVTPGVPTGVVLTPGAFMDNVYIDASWTPPSDGTASAYEIELAKKVSGVYQTLDARRTNGNSIRWNSLEPNTTYGFRVASVSNSAAVSAFVPSTGYTDVTTGFDATVPAQATGLAVYAGLRTIVARWNDNTERDVKFGVGTYKVDCAIDSGFVTIVKTNYLGATVTAFSDLNANTTYYIRVAAIDASGNQGPYSTTVSGTTGQAVHDDIGSGVITYDLIAAATIIGANIAAGTITGGLIAANTIDAHSIKTSTLDVADITLNGGSFKAGTPPTTGLVINSQGIRLYSGGVQQVILDVGGSATFKGTISASTVSGTAISGGTISGTSISGVTITGSTITGGTIRTGSGGPRVEINDTNNSFGGYSYHQIIFHTGYSGGGDYIPGYLFARYIGSGQAQTILGSPKPTSAYGSAQIIFDVWDNGTANLSLSAGGGYIVANNPLFSAGSGPALTGEHIYTSGAAYVESQPTYPSTDTHQLLLAAAGSNFSQSWVAASSDGGPTRWEALDWPLSSYITIYASAFTVSSSRASKKNIAKLEVAHDNFDKLSPRRYERVANAYPGPPISEKREHKKGLYNSEEWGFIADEMIELFPECVDVISGEPFAINYTMLLPVLVDVVQDLRMRVKQLEAA